MAEASQAEVTIHCVDPLALTLLVDFSYTGELAVCEDNVQVRANLVALTSGFVATVRIRLSLQCMAIYCDALLALCHSLYYKFI